jgi:uncharacterized protein YegL
VRLREWGERLLLYVLADASGSTIRDHVNEGLNLAFPRLVTAVEQRFGDAGRFCLISYSSDATVRVPLTRAVDLTMIPPLPPSGLSSMAVGLRLLATTIAADLADTDIPGVPAVALIADDLSTDDGRDLLAARASISVPLVVVLPSDTDPLAVAALDARVHSLDRGSPERACESIVAAVEALLDTLDRRS